MAVFAEDPALKAQLAEPHEVDQFDVGVVSTPVALSLSGNTPLVVCADGEGDMPSLLSKSNVLAILLRRQATPDQLTTAVRAAAAGLRIVNPGSTAADELDERSLAVLRLLATGADTREIARTLSFSERTIKGVIHQVVYLLGARNRAQAVAEAMRRQMI
jgi:DNA-binding NarL/FixJ family response regulator